MQSQSGTQVSIFGQVYHIQGGQDPEHARKVARLVDEKMNLIASQVQSPDSYRVAVLAALLASKGQEHLGFLDRHRVLGGISRRVRTAPLTRSITGVFGRVASHKKLYILSSCSPGRARWPTIDAGRLHRIIKRAVRGTVAPYDRFPAGFVTRERRRDPIGLGRR